MTVRRNASDRLSSYRTSIVAKDGITTIRYADTDIVRFDNNTIVLDTGGYGTVTTKKKMNQASQQFNLGYKVFQKDHQWYVTFDGYTTKWTLGSSQFVIHRKWASAVSERWETICNIS